MRHYCTYFDHHYLTRGLALYRSLARCGGPFTMHVLCLTRRCLAVLRALDWPGLEPVGLGELEAFDPELLVVKPNRTMVEYYFTCSPAFPLFLMRTRPELDALTYLDADLFFFRDPDLVHDEAGGASVVIMPHRFPGRLRHLEAYGVYNVGWITYRNDEAGLRCLEWYRRSCVDWCHDRVDTGRFADQKYLDDVPARFDGVAVIQQKGANLACWNVEQYVLTLGDGGVYVDADPLVFFHFHRVRRLVWRLYDSGFSRWNLSLDPLLRDHLFKPYLRELERVGRELPNPVDSAPGGIRQQGIVSKRPLGYSRQTLRRTLEVLRTSTGVWS